MSSHTYFCRKCGAIRRRRVARWEMSGGPGPDWPYCCEGPMLPLRKAHAEAATKLSREQRLEWIRRGMQVFRRAGRRWTAALSPAQLVRAREQLKTFSDRDGAS